MIVITDDIRFAEQLLGNDLHWKDQPDTSIPFVVKTLCEQVYAGDALFYTKTLPDIPFEYLLLQARAPDSQFELIKSFIRQHPQLRDRLLLAADSGSNFRGFKNRTWAAEAGNIHLTVFFNPQKNIEYFHAGFLILAAISSLQAIDQIPGLEHQGDIRWVNDIMMNDSKVGGVLTFTQSQGNKVTAALLGIGMNVETRPLVKPDRFVKRVACLQEFSEKQGVCTRDVVFRALLRQLALNYEKLLSGAYEELYNFYVQRSQVLERPVEIYSDPSQGDHQKLIEGKVRAIGKNLELYLDGESEPVWKGRLILK
jgi:biotin-[acetyl-CoA-carboxylase] ligase BirA-like protein